MDKNTKMQQYVAYKSHAYFNNTYKLKVKRWVKGFP